ncbi:MULTISPECIES: hypothetical protein [Campylobacter]|uniref:Acyl-CoA thioesterase n=1 Tax=Campylobacter lari TaxID=201 RepID=A0A7U7ZNS9_CAMLA|nr:MULTISPECIES: hypothetical protein [Campylobacter]EAI3905750.1 hypothetical protein [Campylobacter lari]EAI3914258.1 hypothetical protein [Campylobacter lari]EAI4441485.1 hypothetical protein [Campylobacter lari]EAI4448103.1 hypothetical protein [Campylobacter lari]EAI4449247.1 hypothetical protein [Campylobacter lari]
MARTVSAVTIEELIDPEELNRIKSELITCPGINNTLAGSISHIEKNFAKGILITTHDMAVDELGLVHSGFVFNAANYIAQAAINKEFSVLIGSRSFFYAPLKVGDILNLEASALFSDDSRKREVKVAGFVNEIKIFDASFQVITTDDHIFKLKQNQAATNNNQNQQETTKQESMQEELNAVLKGIGG